MAKLSIVATPIGNLEDITLRALRTLKECDVVFAEDTRVTAKLLAKYEISKPVHRLDAETEAKRVSEVADLLEDGKHIVFVSDAGTPGISDPGSRLVARIRETLPAATIEAIPGPSSLTAAISIAGMPTDEFLFLGFLPHKKGRLTALNGVAGRKCPVVLFESPHRIGKLLSELASIGVTQVAVGRELTKLHEEMLVGEPLDIKRDLAARKAERGEFVVIVR